MKRVYEVLAEGWLEDAYGNGAYRLVGEAVTLTDDQAQYLVLSNHVDLVKPAATEKQSKSKD